MTEQDKFYKGDFSVYSLINFLDYCKVSNLMNKTTASAKKSTANVVLINSKILSKSEKLDIRNLDMDKIFDRFLERYPKYYPYESLLTYRSRVKNSVKFFLEYMANPSKYPPDSYGKLASSVRRFEPLEPNVDAQAASNLSDILSKTNLKSNDSLFTFDLQVLIRNKEHTITMLNVPKDLGDNDIKQILAVLNVYAN